MLIRVVSVLLGLALAAGAWAWFVSDEPLDPGALEWIEFHQTRQGDPGEAFLHWLGLDAPPDREPVAAGRDWYREFAVEADAGAGLAGLAVVQAPWRSQRLTRPSMRVTNDWLACREPGVDGCEGLEKFLDAHSLLLDRYRDWPLESGYRLGAPDAELAPHPGPQAAADGLARLAILADLANGSADAARERQARALDRVRAQVRAAETLRQLFLALELFDRHIELALQLHQAGRLMIERPEELLADIKAVDELLHQVFRGEFGRLDYSWEWLQANDTVPEGDGLLARLGYRAFFRPNIMRNTLHEVFRWTASLDSPTDFAAVVTGRQPVWEAPVSLRNYWASLHPEHLPDVAHFLPYVGRLHDLRARLALARAHLAEPSIDDGGLLRLQRANPYGRRYGVSLDEANGQVCFDGPFDGSNGARCIPLANAAP